MYVFELNFTMPGGQRNNAPVAELRTSAAMAQRQAKSEKAFLNEF